MSSIVIAGDTSGSVTLQAPAVSGSTVLNLPATSGTIQASGAGYTTNGVAYATSATGLVTGSALTFDGTKLAILSSSATVLESIKSTSSTSQAALFQVNNDADVPFNIGVFGSTAGTFGVLGASTPFISTNASTLNFVNTNASGAIVYGIGSSAAESMRLNGTGLGIGTSSPAGKLDVRAGTGATLLVAADATNLVSLNNYNSTSGFQDFKYAGSTHQFFTGTAGGGSVSERARITAAGELLLTGLTSPITSGILCIATNLNNNNPIVLKNTTTQGAGQTFAVFTNSSNTQAGAIQHSGSTSVTYSTSSDARLKTDLGVAVSTDVIDDTIIHNFEWKEDNQIDRGVFAQEAYEVKPSAVSVGNDEITEDGNLAKPWGVDYSKYVPDLIVHAQQLKKQVQEQQALITTLTERITALEGV